MAEFMIKIVERTHLMKIGFFKDLEKFNFQKEFKNMYMLLMPSEEANLVSLGKNPAFPKFKDEESEFWY